VDASSTPIAARLRLALYCFLKSLVLFRVARARSRPARKLPARGASRASAWCGAGKWSPTCWPASAAKVTGL
jgi:hypothetical protein